jgi:glycerol kinase
MRVLAIDQGTTNTKAVLIDDQGRVVGRASAPLTTSYPHPGWAEQSASAIWASVQDVIAEIVGTSGPADAIAIANQRETLVVWDAASSQPVCPAPIWQCRRTAPECAALIADGHNDTVRRLTGLGINPLFPASKLAWVLRNVPQARDLLARGQLRAGTVDSWLLWNLTGGASFACDHSNASRTQLFDTATLSFSSELGAIFDAPISCLPAALPSDSHFGSTASGQTALPAGIPVHAIMGDSHAALYGHGIRLPGTVKATYGTGTSLMTLTAARVASGHGLSGTIAWSDSQGTAYALEGNITVSAQAAAYMAGILGLQDAAALSDLAQTVTDNGGVSFIPALAGLGAPHWDDHATGTIMGMTHGTTRAHLARATFEAITLQICDVFTAMEKDIGQPLSSLRADGGASGNAFLMQLQADLLGRPVEAANLEEVGAMGAAAMAFSAYGHRIPLPAVSHSYLPGTSVAGSQTIKALWAQALTKCLAPASVRCT